MFPNGLEELSLADENIYIFFLAKTDENIYLLVDPLSGGVWYMGLDWTKGYCFLR